MKTFVLLCCVVATLALPGNARATGEERFFEAYFLIQQGDTAESAGAWATAHAKFAAALAILDQIKTQFPNWHTDLVAFRRQYCADHLTRLAAKLPEPTLPVVVAPVPSPDAEALHQSQAELQKAQATVQKLAEQRDKLAIELQVRLAEPAPRGSEATKSTLNELRALQAANDAVQANLTAAEEKAARADKLAEDLGAAQKQIQELETGRKVLSEQLQDALAKVAEAQTSPQIEQLLKQNAEATAQLAGAQAEISKLREQVAAAPTAAQVADTIRLRGELTEVQALLAARTTELTQVKAENVRLLTVQEELNAKLAESDRQWRAAKASSEKGDQLIQQLRKENELLKQIAEREGRQPPGEQAQAAPAAGGFLWFKSKAKPRAVVPTNAVATTSQSEAGKLTVTVKAPVQTDSAKSDADQVKAVAAAATDAVAESAEVRLLLGQAGAAIAQQDFATAKLHLATAAAKEPTNVGVLMNLGSVLYRLEQLDEAQDTLRQIVQLAPNQSNARSLLGIICLRRGRTEDAYNELTRAVAIEPRNAEAHNYLGIVMSEKGWATAAEQEIRRALELNPSYADAHFNLAVMYSRQKTPRLELARYHYQKATALGAAPDGKLETVLQTADAAKK